jgi:hypothetical protein
MHLLAIESCRQRSLTEVQAARTQVPSHVSHNLRADENLSFIDYSEYKNHGHRTELLTPGSRRHFFQAGVGLTTGTVQG